MINLDDVNLLPNMPEKFRKEFEILKLKQKAGALSLIESNSLRELPSLTVLLLEAQMLPDELQREFLIATRGLIRFHKELEIVDRLASILEAAPDMPLAIAALALADINETNQDKTLKRYNAISQKVKAWLEENKKE
jgi:hypothetical protein